MADTTLLEKRECPAPAETTDYEGQLEELPVPPSESESEYGSTTSPQTSAYDLDSSALLKTKYNLRGAKGFSDAFFEPDYGSVELTNEEVNFYPRSSSSEGDAIAKVFLSEVLACEQKGENVVLHYFPTQDKESMRRKHICGKLDFATEQDAVDFTASVRERIASDLDSAWNAEGEDNIVRLLVLLNPFGGTGQAKDIWYNKCSPVFELAAPKIKLEVRHTEHAGHSAEIAKEMDFSKYRGVITVSGDGLLHEFLNGVMERADWREVISRVGFSVIAAGSGNGLAAEVHLLDPVSSAFTIAKGFWRPMDLMYTSQDGQPPRWCFLSVTWAIIADVDLGSEGLRWMGPVRFTVAALKRIAEFREYDGIVHYLPEDLQKHHCIPPCSFCQDLVNVNDGASPWEMDWPPLLAEEQGVNPDQVEQDVQVNGKIWRRVRTNFLMFVASNMSMIASDTKIAPYAHCSDGKIDLVYVSSNNVSKIDMLQTMLDLDSGEYVKHDDIVQYKKTTAFMLQPLIEKGRFSLDGEFTNYNPIRVAIYPSCIKLMGSIK